MTYNQVDGVFGAFTGAIAAAVIAAFLIAHADARPPAATDPDLAPWFDSLVQPNGGSCCDTADGHILSDDQWRAREDGGYDVRVDNGQWTSVEPARVLRTTNPTGGAVAFWLPGQSFVYCFVPTYAG